MLGAGVLSTLTFLLMCHSSNTLTDQDGMYLTGGSTWAFGRDLPGGRSMLYTAGLALGR